VRNSDNNGVAPGSELHTLLIWRSPASLSAKSETRPGEHLPSNAALNYARARGAADGTAGLGPRPQQGSPSMTEKITRWKGHYRVLCVRSWSRGAAIPSCRRFSRAAITLRAQHRIAWRRLRICWRLLRSVTAAGRLRGGADQKPRLLCLIGDRRTGLCHIGSPVQLVRSSLPPARPPDEPRRIVARAHTPSGSPNHASAPRGTQPARSDPHK